MEDKSELYLKKLTKEEKEQIKEENKKAGKSRVLVLMIVLMIAIMAGMFAISYFWSMSKLSGKIAIPVMAVCLVIEVVICEIANKMNQQMSK